MKGSSNTKTTGFRPARPPGPASCRAVVPRSGQPPGGRLIKAGPPVAHKHQKKTREGPFLALYIPSPLFKSLPSLGNHCAHSFTQEYEPLCSKSVRLMHKGPFFEYWARDNKRTKKNSLLISNPPANRCTIGTP